MIDYQVVYSSLKNQLEVFDKDRKKYFRKAWPLTLVAILIVIGSGTLLFWNSVIRDQSLSLIIIIAYVMPPLILFVVSMFFFGIRTHEFKAQFVKVIAPAIVSRLGDSFTYDYEGEIPQKDIVKTLLFDAFDEYNCQDLIRGTINGITIRIAEMNMFHTSTDHTRKGSLKAKEEREVVFGGFYFSATLAATFPCKIWLINRRELFNRQRNELFFGVTKNKIKLEGGELQGYSVYAEDEEQAKKVLQPYILKNIAQLNKKLRKEGLTIEKKSTSFYFDGNELNLAFSTHRRLMEPRLYKSVNTPKFIKKQVKLLNAMYSFVYDLNVR